MGTNNDAVNITPKRVPLSPNLSGEVAKALAMAADALLKVANALNGEESFCAQISSPLVSQPPPDAITVGELVREFLLAKARAGKSDRYLRALKNSLSKFSAGRNSLVCHNLTVHDIEGWLESNDWAARTQHGYVGDVRTLFNFAIRRGYLEKNPAAGVELPDCDPAPNSIHTPAQVRAVLAAVRREDLNLCRSLAIRYFAGLRTSEAAGLRESDIGKMIEVTAKNSKTRRRRLVTISDNLRAWLDLGGSVDFGDYGNRTRLFYQRSGVDWPHNVTRHSFCSYHLAAHCNAAKTALEAGHTEQMLFANYREIVTPESAAEFWSIFPM